MNRNYEIVKFKPMHEFQQSLESRSLSELQQQLDEEEEKLTLAMQKHQELQHLEELLKNQKEGNNTDN